MQDEPRPSGSTSVDPSAGFGDPSGTDLDSFVTDTQPALGEPEPSGVVRQWLDSITIRVPDLQRARARSAVSAMVITLVLILVDLLFGLTGGSTLRSINTTITFLLLAALVPLLRVTGSLLLVTHLALSVLALSFAFDYLGALELFHLSLFVALPALAAMFGGRRAAAIWTGVAIVATLVLTAWGEHLLPSSWRLGYARGPESEVFGFLLVVSCVGLIAWYSEVQREQIRSRQRVLGEELRQEKRRLELVANAGFDLFVETNAEGRVTRVLGQNHRALAWRARDLMGVRLASLVHPDDNSEVFEAADSPVRAELRLRRADGDWSWVRLAGGAVLDRRDRAQLGDDGPLDLRCFWAVRVIDAERVTGARIVDLQRLQGIAQMAGGMAHDFKNLLTVIFGWTELLEETDARNQIREAALDASQLTNQLLAFGRRHDLRSEHVDLNVLVNDSEKVLRSLVSEGIRLETGLAEEECIVESNPAQLGQVLVNLATNARDAMPNGGRLVVGTEVVRLDPQRARELGVAAGSYVALQVEDDGHGMPQHVLEKVLEPFFTTKGMGHGTGLGLSSVHAVARQCAGALTVESQLGVGTCVTVWLPSACGLTNSSEVNALLQEASGVPSRTGRVLVVEDQEDILSLTVQVLEGAGHQVVSARSAEEALERVPDPEAIDLLMTDVVMSGLRGPDLASALREKRPGLNVLYVSGYADCELDFAHPHAVTRFLAKPYRPKELLDVIGELLAEGAGENPSVRPTSDTSGAPGLA